MTLLGPALCSLLVAAGVVIGWAFAKWHGRRKDPES